MEIGFQDFVLWAIIALFSVHMVCAYGNHKMFNEYFDVVEATLVDKAVKSEEAHLIGYTMGRAGYQEVYDNIPGKVTRYATFEYKYNDKDYVIDVEYQGSLPDKMDVAVLKQDPTFWVYAEKALTKSQIKEILSHYENVEEV